jgi:hypothetical protein
MVNHDNTYQVKWFRDTGDVTLDTDAAGSPALSDNHSATRRELESEQLLSQRLLIQKLQDNLALGYRELKSSVAAINTNTMDFSTGLATIEDVCSELEGLLEKVRAAAAVTAGQIPTYCGWVRRSSDFSKVEPGKGVRKFNKTAGSMKMWASLIQSTLFFTQQPYGGKVEVEIKLEV